MRVCVLYCGNQPNEPKLKELATKLADGIASNGHTVEAFDMNLEMGKIISFYDYIWPDPSATAEPFICPFCNQGVCKDCNGTGKIRCINCEGSGICPICRGSGKYWGVECQGCHGDRKCWRCHGSKTEACFSCDNGVCSICHGNYTNPFGL